MKKVILLGILGLSVFANAGFETPEENKEKRNAEQIKVNQEYIAQLVGKRAWYSSTDYCSLRGAIYANRDDMSYGAAKFSTNDKFVPIVFLEGEALVETRDNDVVILKLKIDDKDYGYVRTTGYNKIKIKDDSYECFKENNPDDKSVISKKTDYSASLRDWDISCRKDKIDNKKICSMWRDGLTVMMINNRYIIGVGKGDSYPGSNSAIKVDDNIAYFGRERMINLISTNAIIQQLKKGRTAVIRYREWPYDYDKSNEVDLNGFTKKLNEMTDSYNKL